MWENNLKRNNNYYDKIIDNNNYLGDNEINFIYDNKDELS